MKNFLLNFILLSLSSFIAVCCIETLLQYGIIPNEYYTFDAERHGKAAGEEHTRMLILGDSFLRTDSHVASIIKSDLQKRGVSLYNAATSGASPLDYLYQFQYSFKDIQPTEVVIGFFAGNDITDYMYRHLDSSWYYSLRYRLKTYLLRWHVYRVINTYRTNIRMKGLQEEVLGKLESKPINPYLVLEFQKHKDSLAENLLVASETSKRSWIKIQSILKEIVQDARNANASVSLIIFPHPLQVDAKYAPFYAELGARNVEELIHTQTPQLLFKSFCEEISIPCLDLLPPLRLNESEEKDLFFKNDPHLTPHGDEIAAKIILEFLNKELKERLP